MSFQISLPETIIYRINKTYALALSYVISNIVISKMSYK